MNFPDAGLGGHNHCRNPGSEEAGPWCYTTQPGVRFELCDVPPPRANCTLKDSANPYHYHTLCPVDCATLLGNGVCEMRCNITSCAYDRGDCGVGLDIKAVLKDSGIDLGMGAEQAYTLVVGSVAVGLLVGLFILCCVLRKRKADEVKIRGYTLEERVKDQDDL